MGRQCAWRSTSAHVWPVEGHGGLMRPEVCRAPAAREHTAPHRVGVREVVCACRMPYAYDVRIRLHVPCVMHRVSCTVHHAVCDTHCVVYSLAHAYRRSLYATCSMQYAVSSRHYAVCVCNTQHARYSMQYEVCTMAQAPCIIHRAS